MAARASLGAVEAPRLDLLGIAFVAAMHALFVVLSLAAPPAHLAISVVALLGAGAAAWGLGHSGERAGLAALAGGLATLAAARGAWLGLDAGASSSLVMANGAMLTLALAGAAIAAALWAWRPHEAASRGGALRAAFAVAAASCALDMMMALGSGDLTFVLALLLGAVGYSLAAPHVATPPPQPATPAGA